MAEIHNSHGMKIFEVSDGVIKPGVSWTLIAQRAREINKLYRHEEGNGFYTLGIAVSGVALAAEAQSVDTQAFVEAIEPPLNNRELHGFSRGIDHATDQLMNRELGVTV